MKEIGEQEVHIHHTSRSRKFDRSAFKCRGDAESSTFQFLSTVWEFILNECGVPHYMCKSQKKSKNNVVNLLSQIKSPVRLDFGEPN